WLQGPRRSPVAQGPEQGSGTSGRVAQGRCAQPRAAQVVRARGGSFRGVRPSLSGGARTASGVGGRGPSPEARRRPPGGPARSEQGCAPLRGQGVVGRSGGGAA